MPSTTCCWFCYKPPHVAILRAVTLVDTETGKRKQERLCSICVSGFENGGLRAGRYVTEERWAEMPFGR